VPYDVLAAVAASCQNGHRRYNFVVSLASMIVDLPPGSRISTRNRTGRRGDGSFGEGDARDG
jgi:hypothetical protein